MTASEKVYLMMKEALEEEKQAEREAIRLGLGLETKEARESSSQAGITTATTSDSEKAP